MLDLWKAKVASQTVSTFAMVPMSKTQLETGVCLFSFALLWNFDNLLVVSTIKQIQIAVTSTFPYARQRDHTSRFIT